MQHYYLVGRWFVLPIKVYPIAFDSMGVRSEATLVVVNGYKILIDPGVALAPKRYGLPPSDAELKALEIVREKIMEIGRRADIVIVTHYHYDHHPYPDDKEMYEAVFSGKRVFMKSYEDEVTESARKRGKKFYENVKDIAREIITADDSKIRLGGGIILEFSPPVWHGPVGSKVGRVIMVNIRKGRASFIHGSDAQNLADPDALKWVLEHKPTLLIIDGYPTILMGWRVSKKSFVESMENVKKAVTDTPAKTIIIDHHIVRDKNFKEKMKDIYELAEKHGKKVLTAAEYMGMENLLLEAWRKELRNGKLKIDVEEYYRRLYSKIKI
jgi:predicted metallo-beta-lactamase superfamily hydrolase